MVHTSLPTDWERAAIEVHGDNTPRNRFTDTCSTPHLYLLILFIHIRLVLNFFFSHFKGLAKKTTVLRERQRTARGRTQRAMSTLGLDPDLPALLTSD